MGKIWVSNGFTWKDTGVPYVNRGTGYVPGRWVWRHNGTAWVQVWQKDVTPPPAPTVTLGIIGGTKNKINVTVKHNGGGPTVRTVVKVNYRGAWPVNPDTRDGDYYAQTINAEEWSEYWKGQGDRSTATGTKQFPASYQTFTIPLSTTVRVSAWAQDDYFNWSAVGRASINTLNPDPPPPTIVTRSAYVGVGQSHTWNLNGSNWSGTASSNGYLYQAGQYNQEGYWWYGDGPRATIAPAISGQYMSVYVQRVNSSHGVSGGAIIRIGAHQMMSRPAGAPTGLMGAADRATLGRGQGAEVDLGGWATQFQSGYLRGLGIGAVGTTAYTSPYYAVCYGVGTSSGRLYMQWNQYA